MNRLFVRNHINTFSIILFVILFGLVVYIKPSVVFRDNGSVREFGIGYKNKTIIPIWLVSIILAFLSYLFVLYYLAVPKFR